MPWERFGSIPRIRTRLRFVRVCDCRPQVAGQQQFRVAPASMADGLSLNLVGYESRDLSEPTSMHFAVATALGSPTVSISDRLAQLCPWQGSRASAPDPLLECGAARHSWSFTISRLGKMPVDQWNLAVPFSLCCSAFPHPGAVVERYSDINPCSGELQKSDELQSIQHLHPTESGTQGCFVSVHRLRSSRSCAPPELSRCRRKVVHEEGNADQCPPTGGMPDRHR